MSDENEPQKNDAGDNPAATPKEGATATVDAANGGTKDAEFSEVKSPTGAATALPIDPSLDRVYDLTVPVTVEVGHTNLSVQDILQMAPGSVVELDHAADAPVELLVHGKCVAKGEIVVVDDFYGVRITSIGES